MDKTIWLIKDIISQNQYTIIYGNIHDYIRFVSWRDEVYKIIEIDIPRGNSSVFHFKGVKCNVIDAHSFIARSSMDYPYANTVSISQKSLDINKDYNRAMETILNYPYKDRVVNIVERKNNSIFNKDKFYDMTFKGFVLEETDITYNETTSTFIIKEWEKKNV